MGKSFHVFVAEGTIGTISFYFHLMTHVATSGYSMPNFVVKLNKFKVVAKVEKQCREHLLPIDVRVKPFVPF